MADVPNLDRKKDRALLFNQTRSKRSREQDSRLDAPTTTDVEKWASDADHFDFPGVDTKGADPTDLSERDFTATIRGKDEQGNFLTATPATGGRDSEFQFERAITKEVQSARGGTRTEIISSEIESFGTAEDLSKQIGSGAFDPDFL